MSVSEDSVQACTPAQDQEMNYFKIEKIDADTVKYKSKLKFKQFLKGLEEDKSILSEFINILQTSDFKAYFYETPKVTQNTVSSDKFEFVLARSDMLETVVAEESTFEKHFASCENSVTHFLNLGGDAMLVTPCPAPDVDKQVYSSLAPFVRGAPREQVEQFWRTSAKVMLKHLKTKGKNPTWMSTSGLGVYWLHLRLDSRPKYYTYNPYRSK